MHQGYDRMMKNKRKDEGRRMKDEKNTETERQRDAETKCRAISSLCLSVSSSLRPSSLILHPLLTLTLFLAIGCAADRAPRGDLAGPAVSAPTRYEAWSNSVKPARIVNTSHYRIFTTIQDDEFLQKLANVLEGGYDLYRTMAPGVVGSPTPMDCYVFATRAEWEAFTREHTGQDAKLYLQINRGGYTVHDWFVAYYISPVSTFAVSAHEGWHQFVSRNFKDRLPPFLEEGVATQFENISWSNDLPRWNIKRNASRVFRLRQAYEGKYLWPLQQLVTMHAGDVVGQGFEKIESFYSQNWAFVRFCLDYENGKYRTRFLQLLQDTAAGKLTTGAGPNMRRVYGWNPRLVRPMLEKYLGASLDTINADYLAYVKQIAFERFSDQLGG